MSGAIWAIGEPGPDGGLARVSEEAATVVRTLAAEAGVEAAGLVAGSGVAPAAEALARSLPLVRRLEIPGAAGVTWAAAVAPAVAALVERERPAVLVVGATADGRDLAGALSVLLGWGILANVGAVGWGDGGPRTERTAFGGRLVTTARLRSGQGIVTVLANSVDPTPLAEPGRVLEVTAEPATALPAPRVVERVSEAGGAAPIEEASIIVTGGRGVGGPDGFGIVGELAATLGGVVGATRAAVDSGWIPYARQVGQTGKVVRPALYVALGVSGAIQHKVGMQSSGTIVAVNRDPDAPIAEFADLLVVGDLFEVVPAVIARLKARG